MSDAPHGSDPAPTPAAAHANPRVDDRRRPDQEPRGDRRRPGRPRRDFVIGGVIALVAFASGVGLFNGIVMPRLIHGTGEVEVPDLGNLTFEQAEKALVPTSLPISRAGERFDPSVPRGFIISQDPSPGTPVRGHRRVMVTVSLGEQFNSVPALFGETRRGAELLINRAGLTVGGITRAPSDEVGRDLIVGSDPPGETVLPRGTPVSLLISTGIGAETFVMPDVLGREIGGVRRQFEAMGFRVLTPPSAPTTGPIVTQDPPPGVRVTRDTPVTLQAVGRWIR